MSVSEIMIPRGSCFVRSDIGHNRTPHLHVLSLDLCAPPLEGLFVGGVVGGAVQAVGGEGVVVTKSGVTELGRVGLPIRPVFTKTEIALNAMR